MIWDSKVSKIVSQEKELAVFKKHKCTVLLRQMQKHKYCVNAETLCSNYRDFVLKQNIGVVFKMPKCSYICSKQKRSHM